MNLQALLDAHNWRMLRAIARAHHSHFDNLWAKSEAVERIAKLLTDPNAVRRALSRLPEEARESLLTLLTCEGQMVAHRFLERFGPIRPYRPWREDSPRAPWRHPASPAEQLWFLGFIFFHPTDRGKEIVIPDEIRPLLPAPPPPMPVEPMEPLLSSPDPILDIAHLLAYLQGHDVKPFAGRWLTPRRLRVLDAALAYPDPAVAEARSELQTGYIRFLHYLAEVSGLVNAVGGLLKPTPAAWKWLDAAEPERWRTLWDSWQADLHRPARDESLWRRYRLPGGRAFVVALFETLAVQGQDWATWMALSALSKRLRRRCIGADALPPDDDVFTPLQALLTGPLTWTGLARTDAAGSFSLAPIGAWLLELLEEPPTPPTTGPATIRRGDDDHVVVTFPDPPPRPPLRPLVELGLPPEDRLTRRLTRERFVKMLAHGLRRAWMGETLSALTGQDLPSTLLKRLARWEEQARRLKLRRLTVLTVAEADTLDRLAEQRTIRRHFQETLSSHHVVVEPNQAERLLRALQRRDHTPLIEPGVVSPPSLESELLDEGAASQLWLVLRVYLDLADLVCLPTIPPVALLDRLGEELSQDQLSELAALADEAQRHLRDAIDGYTPFPAPLPDVDHAAIRDVIERVLEKGLALEIVYHTAGRGERTRRVVEPLRMEERGGAAYLIAHCRLRREERVFRIDRIEAASVVDD